MLTTVRPLALFPTPGLGDVELAPVVPETDTKVQDLAMLLSILSSLFLIMRP